MSQARVVGAFLAAASAAAAEDQTPPKVGILFFWAYTVHTHVYVAFYTETTHTHTPEKLTVITEERRFLRRLVAVVVAVLLMIFVHRKYK